MTSTFLAIKGSQFFPCWFSCITNHLTFSVFCSPSQPHNLPYSVLGKKENKHIKPIYKQCTSVGNASNWQQRRQNQSSHPLVCILRRKQLVLSFTVASALTQACPQCLPRRLPSESFDCAGKPRCLLQLAEFLRDLSLLLISWRIGETQV